MIPAHYRNTRTLLLIAVVVLFASASQPFAVAVERYTGRDRAPRLVKLSRERSFETHKAKKADKTRANPLKSADSLVAKKYRLEGDRNSPTFRSRKRGR